MSLKTRIANLLPASAECRNLTTGQIRRALNRSATNTPVTDATVRGRLSELVANGTVIRETRDSGLTGFYRAS